MSDWNFGDVWDVVAASFPDRPAVIQGTTRVSWQAFERRAASLAAALLDAGLGHQAKVAQYLYNCPAYLESVYGAFKAGLVPVNTNYRYTDDELVYLWENSDSEAVIFDAAFSERVEAVRKRLPAVRLWLRVGADFPAADWVTDYEAVAARGAEPEPRPRSGDDLLFIYTGGTTGMPKGVMWRQDDLFAVLNRTGEVRYPEEGGMEGVHHTLQQPPKHPPARLLPGPPLMHGTGLFTAMSVLSGGGTVVMTDSHHFDPAALLDLVEAERVTQLCIVGDAFAKPILAALDAQPGRWDLSSLWLIVSSGVMWSAEVKQGLLGHNPKMMLVDTLGSSEAVGMARSTARAGQEVQTADFKLGADTKVLTDDGGELQPGSTDRGRLAIRGRGPIGYYKDAEKSAATFTFIDGQRWTIPGDFATVAADGTVRLLGRGSVCINSGGEKIFPEEVEEVLKLHPGVADAVVVGIPDDRFGEAVTAVIERRPGVPGIDHSELAEWVKKRLAAYKAPRRFVEVDSIGRSPAGKVDYRGLRSLAVERVASAR